MQAGALVGVVGLTGILVVVLIDLASFVLAVLTARRLLVDADVIYQPLLLRFRFSCNTSVTKDLGLRGSRSEPALTATVSEPKPRQRMTTKSGVH